MEPNKKQKLISKCIGNAKHFINLCYGFYINSGAYEHLLLDDFEDLMNIFLTDRAFGLEYIIYDKEEDDFLLYRCTCVTLDDIIETDVYTQPLQQPVYRILGNVELTFDNYVNIPKDIYKEIYDQAKDDQTIFRDSPGDESNEFDYPKIGKPEVITLINIRSQVELFIRVMEYFMFGRNDRPYISNYEYLTSREEYLSMILLINTTSKLIAASFLEPDNNTVVLPYVSTAVDFGLRRATKKEYQTITTKYKTTTDYDHARIRDIRLNPFIVFPQCTIISYTI